MRRKAACACSDCVIETEGEPTLNAICHCANCKQRTGSAFGWSAYFRDEDVLGATGNLNVYPIEDRQRRYFCARCGTTLFWTLTAHPGRTGIAGGCFTETPLPEPTLTASNTGRCAWLTLPEGWATG